MVSATKQDLYEILGVSRTADKEEIKKKFKKLARQLHPDVNPGDKTAERRFKEVSAAYAVLSDDEKRKLYDEFGDIALQMGFDSKKAREYREAVNAGRGGFPGGGFEGFDWTEAAGGGVNFEDIFGDIFGGRARGFGRNRARGPMPGEDVEASLEIDFMTAVKGGQTRISLRDGGFAPGRDTIDVTIPPGVREGQRLRLAGLGAPGDRGAPPGDLYVRLHVREHALYKREGDDLHIEVPITVPEAVSGATVGFPTPSGEVSLKVPAGTQSGRRFRLRGLGVATRSGKGDLYARVVVAIPDKDAPEVRELAQRLAPFYTRDPRADLKL
ncbi:MAG: DnaJ C-terminal domain-containing protein [Planctomycetota bacterium]